MLRAGNPSYRSILDLGVRFGCHLNPIHYVPDVHGSKMHLRAIDVVSLSIALTGAWEPFETKLVTKVVRRGNVAVDVGAHIGYYTLLLSRLVGETGQVYAFEPDSSAFSILEKNVQVNGYRNIVLYRKAVAAEAGRALLDGWVLRNPEQAGKTSGNKACQEVEAVRLDDYLERIGERIDFLKLDIEGQEYNALQGARKIIESNPDVIVLSEFHPDRLSEYGVKPKAYIDFLMEKGFTISGVSASTGELVRIVFPEDPNLYSAIARNYPNLFCSRRVLP